VLFMEKAPQVWGRSWLYHPESAENAYQPSTEMKTTA
jgi:hypothetical protein